MKTWNTGHRAAAAGLLAMILALGLSAKDAAAQLTTILNTETFSSNALPSGWSGNWGGADGADWFWSSNGKGGANGAAMDDIWDYNYTPLATPAENVSAYANSSDSVWVDFDFFWQYNCYDPSYSNVDHINIDANSDKLVDGYVTTLNTYDNTNDCSFDYAQTSSSDWKHYHILIPVGDRTSNMKISWVFIDGQGLSDIAIDNVTITAYSAPPGDLSLLPKTLDFGSATPNSPDTLCLTAYSMGTAPIHIKGYYFSGASSFTLVSGPAVGDSIMPNSNAQYCIQFLPLSGGAINGTFTLITDGVDSGTQSANLKGFGAVPDVSYGVTSLFHNVQTMLSDTSPEAYVPVASNGGGPLHFFGIYFIGLDGGDYYVSRTPANPLPQDMTDSIGIRFVPRIEGRPDASLVIHTDAANTPWDTIPMFGVGTLPHLVITVPPPGSGNTAMFDSVAIGDSVCQTLMLTNVGTDTLQILKQLVTYGDYDFTYHPLTGADTTVPPGDTVYANVCFKPLKQGTRVATIRFFTNIPQTFTKPSLDTGEFDINVTGIGVPNELPMPRTYDGGLNGDTIPVDSQVCVTDTFVNLGAGKLTIDSVKNMNPGITTFSFPPFPIVIPPDSSQTFTCCVILQDTGVFNGGCPGGCAALILWTKETSTWSQLALTMYGTKIGDTAVLEQPFSSTCGPDTATVFVLNTENIPESYTASIVGGSNPGDFTILPPATSPLESVGGVASFRVLFTPSTKSSETSNLTITGGIPQSVPLVALGEAATIAGSGTAPTARPSGLAENFTDTVFNSGSCSWTPGVPSVRGNSPFSYVSGGTSPIPAGGTALLSFTFTPPATEGTYSAALSFPNAQGISIPAAEDTVFGAISSAGVSLKTSQDGFVLGASYPNPTNGQAAIELTLPKDANVRIDLLNATGELVRTAFSGHLSSGTQTVTIDAKGLPSGTYFYMLTSGDVRLTRQLSLVK